VIERFEALRPRLRRVAHGILGSVAEAEDVVQDAWLRLSRSDVAEIQDLEAWLVTVVARRSLDVLRSARSRRETYPGPWLPEPMVEPAPDDDPLGALLLSESIHVAMLRVLETLSPAERAAFVLHDVFGMAFPEVARAVGRTPGACRQLASRARRAVAAGAPRFDAPPAEHEAVVKAFLAACGSRDVEGLLRLLDPRVTAVSDGGGRVSAALRPIAGADRVARFLSGLLGKVTDPLEVRFVWASGRLGLALHRAGRPFAVLSFAVGGGRIHELQMLLNPDKLASIA